LTCDPANPRHPIVSVVSQQIPTSMKSVSINIVQHE
jgi:hypothetical protein